MIRPLSILVGLGFSVAVLWAFGSGAYVAMTEGTGELSAEYAIHEKPHGPEGGFSFEGPLGKFDRAQLQRGFQVYKEVCAACHGLKFVAFRNLQEIGFNEAEVKAIAAATPVPGIDRNTGEATTRSGLPTDYFPSPYANDVAAAAANNNAIPPDLSLMTKARKDGSNYVYSLLKGYGEPGDPEVMAKYPEFETGAGLYFNKYFKNVNIAMAPPLTTDGQVTYAEGNPEPTIQQMSADVAAFLSWAAEPKMEERKKTGLWFLGFMIFVTILAYLSKKQVWAGLKTGRKD
ncbi:MAG TPA: cytochrome c1 [Erythrobacter sp.]|nr:cytochrome c1 [Erythrobacter sp.]